MNKKIVVLLIFVLIIAAFAIYFVVLKASKSTSDNAQPSNTMNIAHTVIYDGKIFTPNSIDAKKGDTIKVTNLSPKKVMIAITGKQAAPVLTIESNGTTSSPAMHEDGKYFFKDMTEALINLPVKKANTTTPDAPQPVKIEHTNESVQITSNGFEPAVVNAKAGVIVKLMNATNTKRTILAGQTKFDISANGSTSLNFDSPGSFTYTNEANKSQVLKIVVE